MKTEALSRVEFETLQKWYETTGDNLPPEICSGLGKIIAVYESLAVMKEKYKDIVLRLREAMGILPKSEKGEQLLSKH